MISAIWEREYWWAYVTYRVTLEDLQDGLEAVVDVGLDELADVRAVGLDVAVLGREVPAFEHAAFEVFEAVVLEGRCL